jgi:type IV secretory pathway VirB10-like protein
MLMRASVVFIAAAAALCAQSQSTSAKASAAKASAAAPALEPRPEPAAQLAAPEAQERAPKVYQVKPGTHIPLSMINSVSTKNAAPGDRVYLETVFPILAGGRIAIPPGSYVAGTITKVQRPGKIHGRGEFYLRFDTLTLPNGVTRDFRARLSGLDGRASEELDRNEGAVKSEGNKGGDARTVAETTAAGASVGGLAGAISHSPGMGAGIGAAAGAAAGLMGVLLSRGPDAVLARGTTIEMVLDRTVTFSGKDLDFSGAPPRVDVGQGPGPLPSRKSQGRPYLGPLIP